MEYQILRSSRDRTKSLKDTVDDLQDQVNKAINQGWKPLGGPVIASTGIVQVAQAMIKE